jgi:hypothetical protein
VEADVIVVRNQGTRSHAEWIWGTEVPQLPLFSLAFIEFWNENYSFHTIWYKETTGWEERATMVVDQRTRQIVDFGSCIYHLLSSTTRPRPHVALICILGKLPDWRFVSCCLSCNPGVLEGSMLH